MCAEAALARCPERRRSTRFPARFILIVSADNGRLREETCTSSLNVHGVLVALETTLTVGQRVVIHNPENWAERNGRVTRLGRCQAGWTEVGIEFTEPNPDFWLIGTISEQSRVDK